MIARESLPEPLRRLFGSIHPLMMSGEYLPALDEDEVEIARITLASVMGDVIELRARRTAKGIRYRMVDEHETEYTIRPCYTREPLTMLELIRAIEGAKPDNPTVDVLRYNLEALDEEEWESMQGFVQVSSPFYPELESWYARYLELWLDHFRRKARRNERGLE